jgi:carboxyl-terminal processing protease
VHPISTPTVQNSPLATPTPSGKADKIDKEAELKAIKAAYDAINKHLYKEPDNAAILTASLKEISTITGVSTAIKPFVGNPEGDWAIFEETYNQILDTAIGKGFEYPKGDLTSRVARKMADAVGDEHTYFMDRSSYGDRQKQSRGDNSNVGFGIFVNNLNNKAFIVRVIPGSGAEEGGLKPGDEIVKYNDTGITYQNWSIVRSAKENETATFTVIRKGSAQPVEIKATKRKYTIPTVEYKMLDNNIGYIRINQFFLNVAGETDKAMRDLFDKGAKAWIIDVRDNPGGWHVERVTGRFVEGGEVMGWNYDRNGKREQKVSNAGVTGDRNNQPFKPVLPVAILVNQGSASSSEMLALAIKDFGIGTIIGEKTAGALGHTSAYPLGDGTAIGVTLDEYESRGGTKANGVGVQPDIEVKRTSDDYVNGRDPQLDAAIKQVEKDLAQKKP